MGDCVELAPLPGDDVTRIAQVRPCNAWHAWCAFLFHR